MKFLFYFATYQIHIWSPRGLIILKWYIIVCATQEQAVLRCVHFIMLSILSSFLFHNTWYPSDTTAQKYEVVVIAVVVFVVSVFVLKEWPYTPGVTGAVGGIAAILTFLLWAREVTCRVRGRYDGSRVIARISQHAVQFANSAIVRRSF